MSRTRRALHCTAVVGVGVATLAVLTPAAVAQAPAPAPAPAAASTAARTVLVDSGVAARLSGSRWDADRGAVGGRSTRTSAPIAGTTDDVRYQTQRFGMSGYRLPVANGSYAVTLHVAENFHGARGRRVFDVSAEGGRFASGLDVFAAVGKHRALRLTRTVAVRDGVLDLGFRARRDLALVAGIEVRPTVVAAAPGPVTGATAVSSGPGRATVSWRPAVSDGGAPVTAYRVIRLGTDATGAGPWTTVLPATARSFEFARLSPSTAYEFLVYGRNAAGAAPATTVRLTTPAAGARDTVQSSATPTAAVSGPVSAPAAPSTTSAAPTPAAPAPAAPAPAAPAPAAPVALAPAAPVARVTTWPSGVFTPGSSPAKHEAIGAWRGRPVDVVVDWSARSTWAEIVNPGWLYDAWAGTPYTKVFGVAMVPEGDPSATIATCAAGTHNARWVEFARNIKNAGLDDETIVRLGWEFNGDWYKWSAKDPVAWVRCWRNIVTSAESVAPALRWDWTTNRGPGQSLADPTRAYPGDGYVDVVGVDSYDGWPGAVDETSWQKHYAGAFGLKFWADFARSHGKQLSVPEWGVYPGTAWAGNNGGDNPFYIAKMVGFFRSQADNLAYEAYFNESASYYAGSLYGPTQNPRAAAEYARLY